MTTAEIMTTVLIMCAMIGVYFLILYFKMDNIEFKINTIKDKVDEIERKIGGEQ